MQTRKLGNSHLNAAALGLGCQIALHGSLQKGLGSCLFPAQPPCRPDGNMDAAALKITAMDIRRIEEAAADITIQGARHPDDLERMSNRSATRHSSIGGIYA